MPAKRKPVADDASQIVLRLSGGLVRRIDDLLEAENEKRGWPKRSRSDLIRELLERAVSEREKK